MIRRVPPSSKRFATAPGLIVAALALAGCKPPKSIDFYRDNPIERDSMVNHCLATNTTSPDCENAITAEAERWGAKDIDGFTVMITGDGRTAEQVAASAGPLPGAPVITGPSKPEPKTKK